MFPLQLKSTNPVYFKRELLPFIKRTYEVKDTAQIEKYLDRFDALRLAAMRAQTPTEASYKAILDYVRELDYLGHFPIGDKRLRLSFKWVHAYNSKNTIEGYDYHLDKICFLYNLAVLQYLEAAHCEVDTEEKIKVCGTKAKQACATFKTVLEMSRKRLYNVSRDLEDMCVDVLYNIAENYASELMWMVAIMKNTQASLASSLAVHCYEANQMLSGMLSSEAVKKEFPKSFPKLVMAKERVFFAEANYLSGQNENENRNYGPALCFMAKAVEAVDEIVKKKLLDGMSPSFVSFVSRNLLSKAKKEYDVLEKDNRIIYHATVPSSASFPKATKLINVEAAEIPSVKMNDENDPFVNMVPTRAKALMGEYEGRAQKFVSTIKEKNNAFSMQTNQKIASLGLPMSLYEVLGNECTVDARQAAPGGIAEIIDDLRTTGVKGMMSRHADLMAAAERNKAVLYVLINSLNALQTEDMAKAAQYGIRWNSSGFRILYNDVYKELEKLQTKLGQALNTDMLLSKKIQVAAPKITVAQQYVVQTQDNAATGADTPVVLAARKVKDILDQINVELGKLKDYNNELTQLLSSDKPIMDFLGICSASQTVSVSSPKFTKAVDSNLLKYKELETKSQECQAAVNDLYTRLCEFNSEYVSASGAMSPTGTSSEEIKDGLMKFNEVRVGMNNGLTFYTELANRTEQLGAKINAMTQSYREEVAAAERNLAAGSPFVIITGMGIDPGAADSPGAPYAPHGGSSPGEGPSPGTGGSYPQPPVEMPPPQVAPQEPAPAAPEPAQQAPAAQQLPQETPAQAPVPPTSVPPQPQQPQPSGVYMPQQPGYQAMPLNMQQQMPGMPPGAAPMGYPMYQGYPPQQPMPGYYGGYQQAAYGMQMPPGQIPGQPYGAPMPGQPQQMPYGAGYGYKPPYRN